MKNVDTNHLKGFLYGFFGAAVISFDGLMVKLTGAAAWNIVFWRGLFIFMAFFLFLCFFHGAKKTALLYRNISLLEVFAGLLWAGSGIFYTISIKMTVAANVLTLLALTPFFAAFFSFILMRERLSLVTLAVQLCGLAGIVIIFSDSLDYQTLLGNTFAIVPPVCVALLLTLLRKQPQTDRCLIGSAGGFFMALIACVITRPGVESVADFLPIIALGLFIVPLGQYGLSTATKHISSSETGIFLPVETVLGIAWISVFLKEFPGQKTLVGGGLILASLIAHTLHKLGEEKKQAH